MRFILKIIIFIFITIIFSFTNLSANDQNNNISFRAHEAIYDLNIGKITNSSKIHNAIGQMHLTVKEVCDGWVVNQNTTVDITDKNGSQIRNLYRYSSWESKENDLFRFLSKANIGINIKEALCFLHTSRILAKAKYVQGDDVS